MLSKYCCNKPSLRVCVGFIKGFEEFNKSYLKTREQEALWYRFNKSLETGKIYFQVL